jgi:arylsulfatase A-like enzyme
MPGEPYSDAEAPNLRQLARQGTSFTNCISNYPVCSPYRAMLMSGRWPYQTGVIDNTLQLRDSETSLGEVFLQAGYRTGYIGKWHLLDSRSDNRHVPKGPGRHGFQDWQIWHNTNAHFEGSFTYDQETGERIRPKGYNATLMTDRALKFIGENRDRAWMLMLSWNPPHSPFRDAPPEFMKRYEPGSLRLRPNVSGADKNLRANLQGYSAHITAIDAEMGRILKRLEETGQDGNTIVVYTSDHGEMMGSQARMGKRLPYEESCKVPFLVRYPGAVPVGGVRAELLSAIDIYPSLCGLAGIPVPGHCAGRDLSGAMRGKEVSSPDSAFLMHIEKDHASGGRNHPAPIFRGIRTRQYTYAVGEIGRWCLYDNREDPYQQHNLVLDSKYAALMSDLDGLVIDWLKEAGDRFPYRGPGDNRIINIG